MEYCVCGAPLKFPKVVVLDCKHNSTLCQDCSRVSNSEKACQRCCIAASTLDEIPLAHEKMAVFENRRVDLSPYSSRLFAQQLGLDDHKHTPTPGEKKRKAGDNSSPSQSPVGQSPCQSRKRLRAQDPPRANRIEERILVSRISQLRTELDETRRTAESQEFAYKERFVVSKQQLADIAKKAKESNNEAIRQIRKQEHIIKTQGYDNEQMNVKLSTAEKAIDTLRLEVQSATQALRGAEKKGADFEDWGRQTEAHHQELVKQMKLDLRSPSKSPCKMTSTSNLPSLQLVGLEETLNIANQTSPASKKKSRASLPATRTPLHRVLQHTPSYRAASAYLSTS